MKPTKQEQIDELKRVNEQLCKANATLNHDLKHSVSLVSVERYIEDVFIDMERGAHRIAEVADVGSKDRLGAKVSAVTWGRARNFVRYFINKHQPKDQKS